VGIGDADPAVHEDPAGDRDPRLAQRLPRARPGIARAFAISALGSITYYVGITYVPAFLTSAGFATVALLVTLTVLLPGTRTASASEPTQPVAQGGEDRVDEVLAEEAVGVGAV